MSNQKGFIGAFITVLIILGILFATLFVRFKTSQEVVSGIIYNTTNDSFVGGNTKFAVRAAVDTYVSDANESDYCIPGNSPYKALINKAAADKTIKVIVTADKYFAVQAPWVCNSNVIVVEQK